VKPLISPLWKLSGKNEKLTTISQTHLKL